MKNIFFKLTLLIFFISMGSGAFACEICGCGVGNFYMGLLPHFNSKFIGVRYQYMHYHTQLASDATQFSNDYYKSIEIWSGWNISSKWQLLTFVPYHINKQYTDDGLKENSGLGDITLLANYNLLQSRHTAGSKMIDQQLSLGAGVKLPTGGYHLDLSNPATNIGDVNSQSGTGSTDFLMSAVYNININKVGFNTSVNYKINTANKSDYKFGNKFTANTIAYLKLRTNGVGIVPNLGVMYQNIAGNHFEKKIVDQTGGQNISTAAGVELTYNKIALGFSTQVPVSQNLSENQTQLKLQGLVHISLAL